VVYAYYLYGHFVLNVAAAAYILWMVAHASRNDIVEACQNAIQNEQARKQCTTLFQVTQGVFFGVAFFVLLVELCTCALPPLAFFRANVMLVDAAQTEPSWSHKT
jgi:hypothetical protein